MFENNLRKKKTLTTTVTMLTVLLLVGLVVYFSLFYTPYEETPIVIEEPVEVEEIVAQPTGYLYFTGIESEGQRGYPRVFDFANGQVRDIAHDTEIHYQQVYPYVGGYAYLQAPFTLQPPESFASPYSQFLELTTPDQSIYTEVFLPGSVTYSEDAQTFVMQGIRRALPEESGRQAIFDPAYNSQIENWSIYIINEDEEIEELITGAISPVWAPDGDAVYVLRWDGVYHYEIESGLLSRVANLPREQLVIGDAFLTSGTRLQLSPEGDALYYSFISDTQQHDYVFKYGFTSTTSATFADYWRLPFGSHTAFTLSPDEQFAAFVLYDLEEEGSFSVRIVDLAQESSSSAVEAETLFTNTGMRVFHLPMLTWSLIPVS